MTVPMGFVQRDGRTALPAGLQFLARPWDEGRLLRVAFAYEQATRHRRCQDSRLLTAHLSADKALTQPQEDRITGPSTNFPVEVPQNRLISAVCLPLR